MSMKLDDIDGNYVVCGRGSGKYNSKGNKTLRRLVASNLPVYMDPRMRRSEKSKLIQDVTLKMYDMNMKFVRTKKNTTRLENLTFEEARTKVAHRFRDAVRSFVAGADKVERNRMKGSD